MAIQQKLEKNLHTLNEKGKMVGCKNYAVSNKHRTEKSGHSSGFYTYLTNNAHTRTHAPPPHARARPEVHVHRHTHKLA